MRQIINEYISKNGIRFHHSLSKHKDEQSDTLQPESHHMCEIILLLSGSATYKIEGQSFVLKPFDAIVIQPNKLHSREICKDEPYERMVLHFSPNLLPSFADLNLLSNYNGSYLPSVLPRKIVEKSNLKELMMECESICKTQSKYTDLRFVGIILKIIETVNEIILRLDDKTSLPPIKIDKISHSCIQFVNEHLTEKEQLTPTNVARVLSISVSHLQHTFKKEIGTTLHAYVHNQKMQLAKNLLQNGKTPQEVALILGYEYYSTFYHNFIKRFSISPTTFAK